jgi:hypothetical protein
VYYPVRACTQSSKLQGFLFSLAVAKRVCVCCTYMYVKTNKDTLMN